MPSCKLALTANGLWTVTSCIDVGHPCGVVKYNESGAEADWYSKNGVIYIDEKSNLEVPAYVHAVILELLGVSDESKLPRSKIEEACSVSGAS